MFWKIAIRDSALVVLCAYCWTLDAALRAETSVAGIAAALAAALTTTLVGFVAHEWGHLVGAWLTGSKVYAPRHPYGLFLFHFDTALNSPRQFVAMSAGGLLVSGVFATSLALLAPLPSLSAIIALALVVIGVIATLINEVPVVWRVARGGPLPTGPVYQPIEAGAA